MSWHEKSQRWFKRFKRPGSDKHQTFCVSAKQLEKQTGCRPTMTASLVAANTWWQQKEAELRSGCKAGDDVAILIAGRLLHDASLASRIGDATTAAILCKAAAEVQRRRSKGQPVPAFNLDLGQFDIRKDHQSPRHRLAPELVSIRESAVQALGLLDRKCSESSTLQESVDEYLALRMLDVEADALTVGRYSWLKMAFGRLTKFAGEDADLSSIDGAAMSRYRSYLLAGGFSNSHVRDCLAATKQFLRWCWETNRIDDLPRNLNSRSLAVSVPKTEPKSFTVEEVKTILKHAKDRLRLYLLLCLNCGMTQVDINDIRPSEYDGKTITRKRSKTKNHENVPKVCYPLWKSTIALLEKFKSTNPERLLLGPDDHPLKTERLDDDGKLVRTDYISQMFRKYMKRLRKRELVDCELSLKVFRKTGANEIRADAGVEYSSLYLGHSPRSLQDLCYTRQSQAKFDAAIYKLGEQFGQ
jgi:integrase